MFFVCVKYISWEGEQLFFDGHAVVAGPLRRTKYMRSIEMLLDQYGVLFCELRRELSTCIF